MIFQNDNDYQQHQENNGFSVNGYYDYNQYENQNLNYDYRPNNNDYYDNEAHNDYNDYYDQNLGYYNYE